MRRPSFHLFLLLAFCVPVYFAGRGEAQLHGDRAVYASVALEMVESGDYLRPRVAGAPYYNKPPLVPWLCAASVGLFGRHPIALSLPSSLCALGAVLLTYLLGRRWLGHAGGLAAGFVLATSPFFIHSTALLRLESPVVLAVAAAVLCIEEGRRRGALLAVAWLAMGLGVMAKGVVALLPLAIYLLAMPLLRQTHPFDRRAFWFGIPVFAAVVAPWYVYMIATEADFLGVHVGEQQAERVVSPWSLSHLLAFLHGNPYQFLRYHWPWLPFLVWGGVRALRIARRGDLRDRYAARLALVWIATLYAILVVLRDSYHRYALPAYPALALLTALPIERTIRPAVARFWRHRAATRLGALEVLGPRLALVFVIALSATLFSAPVSFSRVRYPEVREVAAWHREHPDIPIAVLPGAPLGSIAPLFHVDVGIRISTIPRAAIEERHARGPIAIVHQNEMPLADALAARDVQRVLSGKSFDLYLLPSLSELPNPAASR